MSLARDKVFASIQDELIRWYRRSARSLPWRNSRDPYPIWVSEIMLQQTRVQTVIPYYRRFLTAFPTAKSLAAAPLGEVLKLWEGLGYYARARNLHRAAQEVVRSHGGKLPQGLQQLRQLPGIGRYTAGAIASIAFGLDEPVLDGNVTRVLSRLFCVDGAAGSAALEKKLWSLARGLVPPGQAGTFNQALMDLGATTCTPGKPACGQCPVSGHCMALKKNMQHRLPRTKAHQPLPHYKVAAAVIVKRDRVLLDQRKPDAMLGGLWEFPGGKVKPTESLEEALVREVREELNIEVRVLAPLTTVNHTYSHFRITLHAFLCGHVSGRPKAIACSACKWVPLGRLREYAFPKANHAILQALEGSAQRKAAAPQPKPATPGRPLPRPDTARSTNASRPSKARARSRRRGR